MKNKLAFVLLLMLMVANACSSSGKLTVRDGWSFPAGVGDNGAAYFVIENGTETDDTLLSISSEIASATEVHMSMADGNGVMSMQMEKSIPASSKGKVDFRPGGLHVMLVGLTHNLKIGDTFTLRLHFEKAGEIALQVEVKEQQ